MGNIFMVGKWNMNISGIEEDVFVADMDFIKIVLFGLELDVKGTIVHLMQFDF